jgi:hypothetical protein
MYNQVEITHDTSLQEGIVGCIIAAAYVHGPLTLDDYDRIIEIIAGRELFLDNDIIRIISDQIALRYVLEEDDFLKTCCEKISDDWRRPVFTMVCHLILDERISAAAIRFLRTLKNELLLVDVSDIVEVLQGLHKNKHQLKLQNI